MNKKQPLRIFMPILVLALCAVSVILVNRLFIKEEKGQPQVASEQANLFKEGYIETNVDVLGVDPVANRLVVEVSFIPHGRFDAGDGVLAVPLEVDLSDINGNPILFLADRHMSSREAVIDMHQGDAGDYPFDTHRALIEILVLEKNAQGAWVNVPAQLDFVGHHHGFVFQDTSLPSNSHDYIGFDLVLKRAPLVIWTAVFCMAVMWGLTFVNLFLLWAVLRGKMEADLGLFGYMSGFLVAMYFFRQILPDIPPFIGVYVDYLAFFWVELAAAGISIIFAIVWFRKLIREDPTHEK